MQFVIKVLSKAIKKLYSFPNACITYKILLTIHFTVAYTELSFLKIKIDNIYLRSTISQEKLSEFDIISIKKEMLTEFEYKAYLVILHIKSKKKYKIQNIDIKV